MDVYYDHSFAGRRSVIWGKINSDIYIEGQTFTAHGGWEKCDLIPRPVSAVLKKDPHVPDVRIRHKL